MLMVFAASPRELKVKKKLFFLINCLHLIFDSRSGDSPSESRHELSNCNPRSPFFPPLLAPSRLKCIVGDVGYQLTRQVEFRGFVCNMYLRYTGN